MDACIAQLMPCIGTQGMPKRPSRIYAPDPDTNLTDKLLQPVPLKYKSGMVVTGKELGDTRLAIVDSGCSADTHPLDIAEHCFPGKVVPLIQPITYDTASTPITCTKGATVRYGKWDIAVEVSLSPGSPSLLSVGQRVMQAGFSFIWMRGRKPCLISECMSHPHVSKSSKTFFSVHLP